MPVLQKKGGETKENRVRWYGLKHSEWLSGEEMRQVLSKEK